MVEGWYGQPYPKPLARTREYVEIVRRIVRREEPLEFHGEFYDLPLREGGLGLGKALKSTVHPLRKDIPIYLAAEGPKNVALSAEICDGWLPLFYAPKEDARYRKQLAEGFAKSGDPTKKDRFDVVSSLMVFIGDDVERTADMVRPFIALYAGGMGAKGANFHFEVFARMGWEGVATQVQELYLQGKKKEAAALIPLEMVEDIALVGPLDKIKGELPKWKETCVTTCWSVGRRPSCRCTANCSPSRSSCRATRSRRTCSARARGAMHARTADTRRKSRSARCTLRVRQVRAVTKPTRAWQVAASSEF